MCCLQPERPLRPLCARVGLRTALDSQYRTAVAQLVVRSAKNAQMVITTFRPEIIEKANQFYRVYQKNRVSRIECVSQQEARRVVEEQTRRENIDG